MLINHVLSVQTHELNKELKKAAETDQLQYADLINYNKKHLELISMIKFANEKLSLMATLNIPLFTICHFANVFTMRGFSDNFETHQKILCINLILASLFAVLITIKKAAAVNYEVIFVSVSHSLFRSMKRKISFYLSSQYGKTEILN